MKVLFIGGTGNISTASSRLSIEKGIDLYLLNRGKVKVDLPGSKSILGDIRSNEVATALEGHTWDVVVNFVAYTSEDVQRDFDLFNGKTKHYIFISSASCYQTPLSHPVITESTPLYNPEWEYSNNKILAERKLRALYEKKGFPMTIVRPSHTYDTVIPIALGGFTEFTTPQRILDGKPIIIHGNGKSLWAVTHADDFAKAFVPLLGMKKSIGHAFHITSDELLTWNSIYESLGDVLGKKINPVYIPTDFITKHEPDWYSDLATDKNECVIFDNSKIKHFVPGFTATIPFSQGIKRTIDWFKADSSRMVVNQKDDESMDRIIEIYLNAYNA